MCPAAAPIEKIAGPKIAARRRSKLPKAARSPTTAKSQAGRADLELERTIRPADESRRHLAKEDVEHEIVEIGHANGPEDEPRQELLDRHGLAHRPRRAGDRDGREQKTHGQEREREVGEQVGDERSDHGTRTLSEVLRNTRLWHARSARVCTARDGLEGIDVGEAQAAIGGGFHAASCFELGGGECQLVEADTEMAGDDLRIEDAIDKGRVATFIGIAP